MSEITSNILRTFILNVFFEIYILVVIRFDRAWSAETDFIVSVSDQADRRHELPRASITLVGNLFDLQAKLRDVTITRTLALIRESWAVLASTAHICRYV